MVISVWAKFGAETAVDHQYEEMPICCLRALQVPESQEKRESLRTGRISSIPKAQKLFWSEIDHNLFSLGPGWMVAGCF